MLTKPSTGKNSDLVKSLRDLLSADRVLTDEDSVCLYAQDVHTRSLVALAVVRPESTAELSAVVAATTSAGHAIIARGGGMSYTSGYVPIEANSVIVDMQSMSKIVEINEDDMYVTVECGCTWSDLYNALKERGLRTPYWGTLSGLHATVGGGISQNSIFWGSGKYGSAADSVIGLEVVLANGDVLHTGSSAHENASPFTRYYGPDLTGLFACDTGALGFKAIATLRLIDSSEHRESVSFDFADYPQLVAAMSEISRRGLAEECLAFDPGLTLVRMQRESLMSDMKKFAGVLKSAGSLVGAIKDGAKVAIAGRGFMKDVQYSLHVMIEEATAEAAASVVAKTRKICTQNSGSEIENSIPKILRANPFIPPNSMIGPHGEQWYPVHTVVPHSKAKQAMDAVYAIFAANDAEIEAQGIGLGFLLATVSTNQFIVEPVFFTPDALHEIHHAYVDAKLLKRVPGFESNPAAAELTQRIRDEIVDAFYEIGGVHMQIGKAYPYRRSLRRESLELVSQLKDAVDPRCRVNPGSLGLK